MVKFARSFPIVKNSRRIHCGYVVRPDKCYLFTFTQPEEALYIRYDVRNIPTRSVFNFLKKVVVPTLYTACIQNNYHGAKCFLYPNQKHTTMVNSSLFCFIYRQYYVLDLTTYITLFLK